MCCGRLRWLCRCRPFVFRVRMIAAMLQVGTRSFVSGQRLCRYGRRNKVLLLPIIAAVTFRIPLLGLLMHVALGEFLALRGGRVDNRVAMIRHGEGRTAMLGYKEIGGTCSRAQDA